MLIGCSGIGDTSSHLYKGVCPSICWPVCLSVPCFFSNMEKSKQVPGGTTMHPQAYFPTYFCSFLTFEKTFFLLGTISIFINFCDFCKSVMDGRTDRDICRQTHLLFSVIAIPVILLKRVHSLCEMANN